MKKIILSILTLALFAGTSAFAQSSSQIDLEREARLGKEQQRLESLTSQLAIYQAILPDAEKSKDHTAVVPHTYKIAEISGRVALYSWTGTVLTYFTLAATRGSAPHSFKATLLLSTFAELGIAVISTAISADASSKNSQFTLYFDRKSEMKIRVKMAQLNAQLAATNAVIGVIQSEEQQASAAQ